MARGARILVKGEPAIYHVMSRTALDGFVLGDLEKEELFKIIKHLSDVYFVEVLGFCLMGNHFHLLVKVNTPEKYSDDQILKRLELYYGNEDRVFSESQISHFRSKWSSLSEYVREIKQKFSRFYNKKHGRRGFFWSERFKSVLVENGETLINCLAYIDLNPVRAGIVKRPENYRWCSLGYHIQTNNRDQFLSLDFGLWQLKKASLSRRLQVYREFVYEKGGIKVLKGKTIPSLIIEKERKNKFSLGQIDRFKYRTRYFSDGAIIGSKQFVSQYYDIFKSHFQSVHEKPPKTISGLDGIFSLKRLSETI